MQSGEQWQMKHMSAICSKEGVKKLKTAAIYARFSSDMQKDRSIGDQIALCEIHAIREGYKVIARYEDRAKSGATLFDRTGIHDLRMAAKRGEFNAIIVENLDRLSRDTEDLAGLFKRLTAWGVELISVNEGVTTDIHVGFRGMMGSMFLKDLAAKVKRGQAGLLSEGKVPGSVTYGYDRVWDEPNRVYKAGERVINPTTAPVVRRIFEEYAAGMSPREIAIGLTRDGIPTPQGLKEWNHQAFLSGNYKAGILSNRMYIGELVWNTHKNVLDPDTGKKFKRPTPESEHVVVQKPDLRIIDQDLWERAQMRREDRKVARGKEVADWTKASRSVKKVTPRVKHGQYLLTGILHCGVCGGHMRIGQSSRDGTPRVVCAAAHMYTTCTSKRSYDLRNLETAVLDGFKHNLLNPEAIKRALKEYHDRYAENQKRNSFDRIELEKKISRLQVQIDRLVDVLLDVDKDSGVPPKVIGKQISEKESEKVILEGKLELLKADNVVTLHPKALAAYRENVAELHNALTGGRPDIGKRVAFQSLIDRVVVHPTAKRMPCEVSVYGRISAMLGVNLSPQPESVKEIVEDQGLPGSDNVNWENVGIV